VAVEALTIPTRAGSVVGNLAAQFVNRWGDRDEPAAVDAIG
jgi:hypothetical protein